LHSAPATGEQFQKGYICPKVRSSRFRSAPPGPGADRDGHAIDGGDPERRGLLLHLQRAERKAAFMQQNVVDQRVIAIYFDKNRTSSASPITAAGRQDLRLHQPHHADQRPGAELLTPLSTAEPALIRHHRA